ncbi:MAG: hypothetical protein WD275_07980 [Rhodothermales bacterium]
MQLILDNLAAVVIAGVLFLILVGVNQRSRIAAVETSNYYALKQQQLSFVEVLKRDMQNVTSVESITEDPATLQFQFTARTDPADNIERTVIYRRVITGQQDGLQLYQIQRLVNGVAQGGSMSTIVEWEITSQNEEGAQVTDIADARQVYVRFAAVNPYQAGETVDRSRWEAAFRPPLLQQATSI